MRYLLFLIPITLQILQLE
jgi:hypothetical protein